MTQSVKIVFLGTPTFACPVLAALKVDPRFEIMAVITQEDKPVGRKQILTAPPLKEKALELGLPVHQPVKLNKDVQLLEKIKNWEIDFLVVVAYGQILSQKVLDLPKIKAINIHGSILPLYRGASPIEQSLLNNDKETGISIMEMTLKMDVGPVYETLRLPILDSDNNSTLREKLSELGAKELPDILIKIKENVLTATPQDESKATYCQKITKEAGHINPLEESAEQIIGKLKAFNPWPGISLKIQDKQCKILQAELTYQSNPAPGKFIIENQQLFLGTAKGTIKINELQLEGKNPMPTKVFLSGNQRLFI